MTNCLNCDKIIENRNAKAKYCSDKCRLRYWINHNRKRFNKSALQSSIRWQKKKRIEWEKQKLCVKCGGERVEGMLYCAKCRELWLRGKRLNTKKEIE